MKTRQEILEESFSEISKHRRRSAAISVGVGKTLLGLTDMEKELQENPSSKFLVVIPKLAVRQTWIDEAVKHNKKEIIDKMCFVTYRSFIKSNLSYTSIYLDEVHNLKFSHGEYLTHYKGKILGLTGSPPRNPKSEKGLMLRAYAPIVYEYITDDAVDDKILNDYKIYVHCIDLDKAKTIVNKTKTGKVFMNSEVDSYNYWSKRIENASSDYEAKMCRLMRMKAMQSFTSKELKVKQLTTLINDKCLIFCNTTAQADKLCNHVYHSKNKSNDVNLEAFKKGEITMLASVSQLKEGINIPGLKASIILHSFASEYVTKQRIGRLVRLPVDELAVIHILMYKNTIDEEWVSKALQDYSQEKIIYLC
jgi:superfamily II DNA or RNA helicase